MRCVHTVQSNTLTLTHFTPVVFFLHLLFNFYAALMNCCCDPTYQMEINTIIQCYSNSIYYFVSDTSYLYCNCLDNNEIFKAKNCLIKKTIWYNKNSSVIHSIWHLYVKRSEILQVVNRKNNKIMLCPGHFICMEMLQ